MKKILIIEDEAPFREAVAFALEGEGYKVLQAENGAEGIELARTQIPDLILSDVMMDSVDGYEAVVSLRQNPKTSGIPIILMTGKVDNTGLVRAIELGADDYLSKPFTMSELLEAISIRFKKQEEVRTLMQEKISDPRSFLTLGIPTDLRTPVAGILGFSKAISREYVDLKQSEIIELGRAIQKAARNVMRVAENFSVLAQIEIVARDEEKLKGLRGFTTPLAKNVVEPVAIDLAHQYDREDDLVVMMSDTPVACSSEYLGKIAKELIDNAMRHSPKGQKVQVSALSSEGLFSFIVTDFGRGMTPQQIGDVQNYSNLSSRLNEDRYFGWGLIVVKPLVELHHGSLVLASGGAAGMMAKVVLPVPV
ncbi:MAG: hybrid sensor histidine kinase/response regulator [Ignavibacteriales bacterium]|nr:hybrid sensor histidine kinase/response regulator [Ignavibacteriales bacterium]